MLHNPRHAINDSTKFEINFFCNNVSSQRLKAKILKFRYSSKAPKVNKASCNNNNNNNKDDNNNGGGPRWDMEEIKSNVALLLEGKPYEEMHEFCDFTLEEQNEVQVAKGVQPSAPSDFKPIIKKNVSYIVAGKHP